MMVNVTLSYIITTLCLSDHNTFTENDNKKGYCVTQKTYYYKRSEYMYEDINIQIVLTTLRKETIMCCNFKKIHNLESYKGL